MPNVIVIGLGISGAAACYELTRLGLRVTAIEARDRIGGRIHSIKLTDGTIAEMGASALHGKGGVLGGRNPLLPLLSRYGIERVVEKSAGIINSDNERGFIFLKDSIEMFSYHREAGRIIREVTRLGAQLQKDPNKQDISVLTALRYAGYNYQKELNSVREYWIKRWLYNAFEERVCAPLHTVSLRELFRRKKYAGRNEFLINGLERIVNGRLEEASRTGLLECFLNCPVTDIKYGEKAPASVKCENGYQFEADAIVCTAPLGVLKGALMHFQPALPSWMQRSISNLNMGMHNKVVLSFDHCFWNVDVQGFIIKGTEGIIRNLYPITGSSTLVMNFVGNAALRSADDNKNLFLNTLKNRFKEDFVYPSSANVSSWHSDPFSGGSYSYHPLGSSSDDTKNLATPIGNLFFAGEATNVFRALHGAYLSGLQVTDRVIAYLKQQ